MWDAELISSLSCKMGMDESVLRELSCVLELCIFVL